MSKGIFPPKLHQALFEMAFQHIEKNKPPMGDHSQKTWKLGKLVSASMLTIHSVHTSVSMSMVNNVRLLMLWPQAFEWIQYLRHSIDHLHNHATGDDVESVCRNFAFRIRCFIYAASKSPVVRDSRLRDLDVVKFIAEWWASGNVIRRKTDEATQAIVDLNFLLNNAEGTTQFLSTLLMTFGSAENLAHFAVRNAHNALCGRNNGMVMPACYVGVSLLLLRMKDPISQAVLEKGVVSSLLKTMGVLVGLPLYQRANTLGLALQTLIEVFRCQNAVNWIAQGFHHEMWDILSKIRHIPDIHAKSELPFAIKLVRDLLPTFMRFNTVFNAAYMRKNGPPARFTDVGDSPTQYKVAWGILESCFLEHVDMRRRRGTDFRDADVYCRNVSAERQSIHIIHLQVVHKPLCRTKGPDPIFSKCGGCKLALYCTASCQKIAWKACHRNECKEIQKQKGEVHS